MKKLIISLALFIAFAGTCHAQKLVYLGCDISSPEGKPSRHFDFTLDEANQTVSFYVKEANAMNKEKALFAADTVSWTNEIEGLISTSRTINRVTLAFTEVVSVGDNRREETGKCVVVKPPVRKF